MHQKRAKRPNKLKKSRDICENIIVNLLQFWVYRYYNDIYKKGLVYAYMLAPLMHGEAMQKAGILQGELQNCRNKNLTKRKTRNVLRIIDGSVDVGNDRIKKRLTCKSK